MKLIALFSKCDSTQQIFSMNAHLVPFYTILIRLLPFAPEFIFLEKSLGDVYFFVWSRLLNLSLEDALSFVSVFKHSVLKRETVVIAMTTLHKDRSEPGAVSCLLVATENREIFIFDPQAFTILVKVCV